MSEFGIRETEFFYLIIRSDGASRQYSKTADSSTVSQNNDRGITIRDLCANTAILTKKVETLQIQVCGYKADYRAAYSAPCRDGVHCTCVPVLTKRAEVAEGQVETLRSALKDIGRERVVLVRDAVATVQGMATIAQKALEITK